jgi:hypothetical protein
MATALACPRCAILATKEEDGDIVKMAYDVGAWSQHWAHPHVGSLTLCPEMRPVLYLTPDEETKVVEVRNGSAK